MLLFLAFPQRGHAAVTWQGLWAESDSRSITLNWETGTEFDNQGFYVLRAEAESGPFARLDGSWTLAKGGVIGSSYRWTDKSPRAGTSYYYWIESISQDNESERHGQNGKPVCARRGGEACSSSSTSTPTRQVSATPTRRVATPQPSRTPTKSPTADGPTPVRVPTGAGGDDYGGSRNQPAPTAEPSRRPGPRATQSDEASTRATESSADRRGRLVTASARGSARALTATPSRLAARADTALTREAKGAHSPDRARLSEDAALEGPVESNASGREANAARSDQEPPSERKSDASGRDAAGSRRADTQAHSDAPDPAKPGLLTLFMLGLLALGLGMRVWTLIRAR